jgi:hypothetical protein
MHTRLLIICCLLPCLHCFAQQEVLSHIPKSVSRYQDCIPSGFDTLAVASGDLNEDGKEDVVLVLNSKGEDSIGGTDELNRILIVLFKSGDGFTVISKSDKPVKCKNCGGGGWGDPFNEIVIENGTLSIAHHGGGTMRWDKINKFRYQDGDFYMIGITSDQFNNIKLCDGGQFADTDYEDINLVTGEREIKKIDGNCKTIIDKTDKLKVKPLMRMVDYKIY